MDLNLLLSKRFPAGPSPLQRGPARAGLLGAGISRGMRNSRSTRFSAIIDDREQGTGSDY